jgi:hypothetical protein
MALIRPKYSQIYDTDYKQSVRVATTGDVGNLLATGNMTNSIDGKTLNLNDRILVKDQSDAKQNGIYRVVTAGTGSNGTWIRALDADASDKVTSGMTTTAAEGDTHGSKTFKLTTPDPITLGVTGLTFINPFVAGSAAAAGANTQVQFNDSGDAGASAGLTFNKAGNILTVGGTIQSTGIMYANNSAASSSITTGALVVGGGLGVAGNVYATTLYGNIGGGSTLANVYITGSLIPTANVTYDLGTPTQKFRSAYFSGSTIYIGDESISVDSSGTWAFTSNGATISLGATAEFNPSNANISGNVIAGNFNFANGVSIVTTLSNAITTANTALKGYTDAANTIQSTEVAAIGNSVTGANAAIVTANTAMKGYVDGQITTVTNSVTGANAAIVTANTAMKGYVDSIDATKANLSGAAFSGNISFPYIVGDANIDGNLTVTGNLNVAGSETVFNTNNLVVNDSLIYLADDNVGDVLDIGFVASFTNPGYQHTGLVRDAGDGVWKLFANVVSEPTTTVDFTNATYSNLKVGNLITTSVTYANGQSILTNVESAIAAIPVYTAGITAPSSPKSNDVWYDTATDITFLYINDGDSNQWVDITSTPLNVAVSTVTGTTLSISGAGSIGTTFSSGAHTITGSPTTALINGGTNGVGNIGASGATFNTIFAKSTSAQYADLAEKYTSDNEYNPGTVLIFGGLQEVTISTNSHDPTVAGVVTTNPAYLMNNDIIGVAVALTGRVPCQVKGPVNKGDRLVSSSTHGTAQRLSMSEYTPGCIIGKSLETIETNEIKLIEVAIGRF